MAPNSDIINPNENISIPSWIGIEYFKDILAKDEPESVGVRNFKPIAATPPGENFTSVMLRIHMDLDMKDGSTKHKTYILKTMLDDDKGGAEIKKSAIFPKELEMYHTYLPAFEELYKAVDWNIEFAPKCLFTEIKDRHINFVLEDLGVKNYINLDRLEGCDMKHMKRILRKLAEFHAASAVYEERNGKYPKNFQVGFVDSEHSFEFQKNLFSSKSCLYKNAMKTWGIENIDNYIEKFPTFDQYWKCCLSTLKQEKNTFNVLTHGDFWSSNIMFSYLSSGEISDLMLVDFQFCKWGSPAEDLLFFISISAAKDIRIKEFDHFVAIYHERLIECLKVLGYTKPLPKLRDLQKDMLDKNNSFYAFFACFNHISIVMLPSDKDANLQNISLPGEIGEQFRIKILTNPRYVEAMQDLFPFYHRRGLFNFEDYDDN